MEYAIVTLYVVDREVVAMFARPCTRQAVHFGRRRSAESARAARTGMTEVIGPNLVASHPKGRSEAQDAAAAALTATVASPPEVMPPVDR